MEEGKETKGKLMMEMKRQRASGRDSKEERDRLSELSDCVLLHIMKFMDTRYAVQTCILSKRWKNLWKCLTTLYFHDRYFRSIENFNKFVSQVLSSRDSSIPVLNLHFCPFNITPAKLLNRVMKYAVMHNVQKLRINISFPTNMPNLFDPQIFSCPSLTVLELYNSGPPLELPKFLQLPALKNLLLTNVSFTPSDNDCAEPFSTCKLLNTLVLQGCSLHKDAKVLLISNSNLSSLNLDNTFQATPNNLDTFQHKIVLSTPNLSSLTIMDYLSFSCHQLSSTCDLSFLEEGSICTTLPKIIGWLQVFTNVKTLTLNSETLRILLNDLSKLPTMSTQPPCLVRLESLKVQMIPWISISDEEVNKSCYHKLLKVISLVSDALFLGRIVGNIKEVEEKVLRGRYRTKGMEISVLN
ncbi:putative F-box/LRR-repeat protein, partial [Mucuna pruriens]